MADIRLRSQLADPQRRRRTAAAVLCLLTALLLAADTTEEESSSIPTAGTPARLIRVPLPITGSVDDRVKQRIDQALKDFPLDQGRPILVLEFSPRGDGSGEGSQFERSFALARYLTSEQLSSARTIAYLPRTVQGHAVLVALACEEIVMHPEAELGSAGLDETTVDDTVRSAYSEIADRSRTVPSAVALGMLDRQLETFQVETTGGTQYVSRVDLERLKQDTAVTSIKTIIPSDEMGRFTGREMRLQFGFVSRLVGDRAELANILQLPSRALEQDPSLVDGQWHPIQVKLTGAVDANNRRRVQQSIEDSVRNGDTNFVCIWLDSPGGSPEETLGLANFLADLDSSRVRTVAYVPSEARADAALVAFACDDLVMDEEAILGGSGVYQMTSAEIGDVRTALVESLAPKKSAGWSLLAAMIDPELVVHQYTLKGSELTQYFCEQELASQSDPKRWEKGAQEAAAGEIYKVTGHRGVQVGLVKHLAGSFDQFKRIYHLEDDPALVEPGWAEVLITALARPELAGTLVFVGFFALIFEFMTPGIGAGGFVAMLCYMLFFWSNFLNGTAGWLEILLFAGGISCVALEIFVIPGFGIFGLGGGAMVILSLVLASQTFLQLPQNEYQLAEFRDSLLVVAAAGAGLVASLVLFHRYAHRAPLVRNVMLAPPEGEELDEIQHRESLVQWDYLLGKRGTTKTKLTPAGKARFGDELVDVVSDGDLIPPGTEIYVVEVRGNRVVVDRVQ